MKKLIFALATLFTMTVSANAMSYEQARDQALFLTDKMAYELNLTEDQYEAAYEINLDYLMSIDNYDDLYGVYWTRRNLDLSYILLDWQYSAYCAASYFYRPLYWEAGYWHFGIYARYPHRTYFYFGRPHFYLTYHGGHSWRMNGGRSWYHGRTYGATHRHGSNHHGFGMRNGLDRGDYRNHSGHFERSHNGRALERRAGTVGQDRRRDDRNMQRSESSRSHDRSMQRSESSRSHDRSMQRSENSRSIERRSTDMNSRSNGSFGNSRSRSNGSFNGNSNRSSNVDRSATRNSNINRSSGYSSRQSSTRSYGDSRSSSRGSFSAPSRSFSSGSSSHSRSMSAPSSRSGGSFSGSHGGGSHHSSGGGSRMGGRR